MVKTSECFSHMPLTEKGCYIQFYKGPGGTDPTERRVFVGSCTEHRTSQLPLNQCEWGLMKAVVGQIWVWGCIFPSCLTKKAPGERTVWCSDPSPLFSLVEWELWLSFFFRRELRLWNQSKNKSCTKKSSLKRQKLTTLGKTIREECEQHSISRGLYTYLIPHWSSGLLVPTRYKRDSLHFHVVLLHNQPHSFTTLS